jgi:hypothetical protein
MAIRYTSRDFDNRILLRNSILKTVRPSLLSLLLTNSEASFNLSHKHIHGERNA